MEKDYSLLPRAAASLETVNSEDDASPAPYDAQTVRICPH